MEMQKFRTLLALCTLVFCMPSQATGLEVKWSMHGRLKPPFNHCVRIDEPADSNNNVWKDNFLCFNQKDHGFSYSYSGPIQGQNCKNLSIKDGPWRDNYLCRVKGDFGWFPRRLERGYTCIRIIEPVDPDPRANGKRYGNHFCLPK